MENDDLAQAGEQISLSHQQAKTRLHALQDNQGKEPNPQPHSIPLLSEAKQFREN
jgi:hypothetical protein